MTDNNIVLQSTELAFSHYKMTLLTRKAVYVLCSLVNTNNDRYKTSITLSDLCKRLNISLTDTRQKRNLLKGLNELRTSCITFGKPEALFEEDFRWVNWFQELTYDKKTREISILWSDSLGAMVTNQQKSFSEIDLETVLSFKSFYALRLYELCLARSGFAGKSGNYKNTWFLKLTADELTQYLFGDLYTDFRDKIKMLKKAVAEINEKAGFKCELMPPSTGKRYQQNEIFFFTCEKNVEKVLEKKQKKAADNAKKAVERIDPIEKTFAVAVKMPAFMELYNRLLEQKDALTFEKTIKEKALKEFGLIDGI